MRAELSRIVPSPRINQFYYALTYFKDDDSVAARTTFYAIHDYEAKSIAKSEADLYAVDDLNLDVKLEMAGTYED
jgi:hypothetical protein